MPARIFLRFVLRGGMVSCIALPLALAPHAAQAANAPIATDILPSGVPLPVPGETYTSPTEDATTRLLGNLAGLRDKLSNAGVKLTVQDVEETWGMLSGGLRSGASYDGITSMALSVDTGPALGWKGGLFNISALQIRGRSFSGDYVGSLNPVSGYDAGTSSRLFELWYGQSLFNNKVDIRVGSLDLDTEFLVSQNASFFLNASFGWPLSTSNNLYSGGPSWPYSALGGRLRWTVSDPVLVMVAVTDDNPTKGPFYNSSDTNDASGTTFSTTGGALFMGEAQYQADISRWFGSRARGALPGVWKFGGLYDTGKFPDQRYDNKGGLLASPASDGVALFHHGDWMAYAVIDQMIWRQAKGSGKTINMFIRVTANDGVQNRFASEVQAGFTFDELLPGRPDDTVGIAWGAGFYGRRAYQNARDALRLGTSTEGRLTPEHHIELTYQAAITPWLTMQPDFQYFIHVGGTSIDADTGTHIRDAAVAGFNMTTTF